MIRTVFCCILALSLGSSAYADPDSRNRTLRASDALFEQGRFQDALIALGPLLKSPTKSTQQEKALWAADRLASLCCDVFNHAVEHAEHGKDFKSYNTYEPVEKVNGLGAGLVWDHYGGYDYFHTFTKRLLREYPNSKHCVSAEYFAIEKGLDERKAVERWLRDLKAYLNKYGDQRVREVALAQLDIANISDSMWALVTQPGWSSGDPKRDAQDAERFKEQAMKYYVLFLKSGEELSDNGKGEETDPVSRLRDIPLGKHSMFVAVSED
mgnify:CR=1 FL=1